MVNARETLSGDRLRAGRRRRTTEEIRRAALRLFAKKGFSSVTIDDITAESMISHRTFFRYFISKEDILMDSQRFVEAIRESLHSSSPGEPHYFALRGAVFDAVEQFETSDRTNLKNIRLILKRNPELIASGTGYILSAMDPIVDEVAARMNVDADADIRPTIMVGAICVAVMSAMRVWVNSADPEPLPAVADKALNQLAGWGDEAAALATTGQVTVKRK